MWGHVFSFIGILISYYGINSNTFSEYITNPKWAKATRITLHALFMICFGFALLYVFADGRKSTEMATTIVSDSKNILDLKEQNKGLSKQLADANLAIQGNQSSCSKATYDQIHETEGRMLYDFTQHTNDIIVNANSHADKLYNTVDSLEKLISNSNRNHGLKPAHIIFFGSSNENFNAELRGDSLYAKFDFGNDGDLVAYHTTLSAHMIVSIGKSAYELDRANTPPRVLDLSSNSPETGMEAKPKQFD